ncbi:MAG: zinc ribbon domain-containing protein [Thermodesulfobacteriota bacterium]
MPLYAFRCPACGQDFDRFLRLSELRQGAPCPACKAPVQHPAGGGQAAAQAQAASPAPGQGSCLIPQRG